MALRQPRVGQHEGVGLTLALSVVAARVSHRCRAQLELKPVSDRKTLTLSKKPRSFGQSKTLKHDAKTACLVRYPSLEQQRALPRTVL